ncbi:GFA family protein [Devosia sp.]|uniref:GFA family protein n=1 Tax=Devosia sp. TaxID=1871048 RepID=UPI001B14B616|nr:GFA family protein [Devosia sp.]MBO9588875.1 GFA family protein [Devosia sp.]
MPDAVEDIIATCHCGTVTIRLPKAPSEITHCNCSLCRRYGVLWAYYEIADVVIATKRPTDTYAWGGKNVDFHRCFDCGCVTHWYPRKSSRTSLGVNARLLDQKLLSAADVRYKDSAGTGLFH